MCANNRPFGSRIQRQVGALVVEVRDFVPLTLGRSEFGFGAIESPTVWQVEHPSRASPETTDDSKPVHDDGFGGSTGLDELKIGGLGGVEPSTGAKLLQISDDGLGQNAF